MCVLLFDNLYSDVWDFFSIWVLLYILNFNDLFMLKRYDNFFFKLEEGGLFWVNFFWCSRNSKVKELYVILGIYLEIFLRILVCLLEKDKGEL